MSRPLATSSNERKDKRMTGDMEKNKAIFEKVETFRCMLGTQTKTIHVVPSKSVEIQPAVFGLAMFLSSLIGDFTIGRKLGGGSVFG